MDPSSQTEWAEPQGPLTLHGVSSVLLSCGSALGPSVRPQRPSDRMGSFATVIGLAAALTVIKTSRVPPQPSPRSAALLGDEAEGGSDYAVPGTR